MRKSFKLREIKKSDWKILLEWRNDKITRQNSFNSELISINKHKEYIENTIVNPDRTLYILEYNDIKLDWPATIYIFSLNWIIIGFGNKLFIGFVNDILIDLFNGIHWSLIIWGNV